MKDKAWKPTIITRNGPSISYLLFANDVIFFSQATKKQAQCIQNTISQFCGAFKMAINYQKFCVKRSIAMKIKVVFDVRLTKNLGKYLEAPFVIR